LPLYSNSDIFIVVRIITTIIVWKPCSIYIILDDKIWHNGRNCPSGTNYNICSYKWDDNCTGFHGYP